MLPRVVSLLLGLWLMVAPAVLGYGGAAAASDRIAGPLAASFALVAIWEVTRALRFGEAVVGLWLLVAPWVTGAPGVATASSLVVGLLLVVLATTGGEVTGRYGGGWRSLWRRDPERSAPGRTANDRT